MEHVCWTTPSELEAERRMGMRHRRRRLLLAALLIAVMVMCGPTVHGNVTGSETEPANPDEIGVDENQMVEEKRPLVVAHRGASGAAPENTMAAFERAVEMGADMIELDVHATEDGHIVVIHDAVLNRTTTGERERLGCVVHPRGDQDAGCRVLERD
jgi:hypothetical protein